MRKESAFDKVEKINKIFSILTIVMWISFILGLMILTWFLPIFPSGYYVGKSDIFLFLAASNRPRFFIIVAAIFIIIFIASLLLRKKIKRKYMEFLL